MSSRWQGHRRDLPVGRCRPCLHLLRCWPSRWGIISGVPAPVRALGANSGRCCTMGAESLQLSRGYAGLGGPYTGRKVDSVLSMRHAPAGRQDAVPGKAHPSILRILSPNP